MFKYNIPDPNSLEVVSDWAELFVAYNKDSLSKAELGAYILSSSGSEADDDFIDSVWNVLRDRAILYGDSPPYNVEPKLINFSIDWEAYPEYLACLIYALEGNPNTESASAAEAGKYFERISNEAVRNYIGGESMIYGFPSEQTVQEIAENFLKERFIYTPPSYRKDRDLDIVAIKPWGDNRPSQIVFLIQCAAGSNWKTKIKDLNLEAWKKYIHFAAVPIKGFSVPIFISDPEQWHEISTDAGILLDRPRLYKQTNGQVMSDTVLRPTLLNWCNDRIAELNN